MISLLDWGVRTAGAGCVQPRPSIPHLPKSLLTLPIRSCLRNLFGCARNKVPPHQDLFRKGRPANQQYATSISTFELDTRAICPKIVEIRRVNRLTIDLGIACQQQCCMLKRRVQPKLQAPACVQSNVHPNNR